LTEPRASVQPFDWALRYPSQREGVLARHVVATSQPLAAQAGLDAMRAGGNAVDAAIAAAVALAVVEPAANGIGGDNFALLWSGGALHALNASGRSPQAMTPGRYAGEIRTHGWDGVTVPGAVSGWVALHERFGALPLERLFAPAIAYARNGFIVSHQTGELWRTAVTAFRDFPDFLATFAPGGRAPLPGEVFRNPDQAATLAEIAATRGESFYSGALARRIDAHARATGGALRLEDLAQHRAAWVDPLAIEYRGHALHELPPNGQGLVALIALGILQHLGIDSIDPDSAEALHLAIEAVKVAFADGHRHIADPAHMRVTAESLLEAGYLAERARLIDRTRAQDFDHGPPAHGGTVYLCTADADGNMVSMIQSNYRGFGSGIVVPGTGIALHNRGCCFTLDEGHPNRLGPGKRPFNTIIPGFVTRGGDPLMAFGVMGGYMQPQGQLQVLLRLVDHAQNPQTALDAPRFQVESGLSVAIEPGFAPTVYEELRARGHALQLAPRRSLSFGRGQAIYRLDHGGYFAASDGRADGQAVGF
jgi:gamma-glutamyltranspeptidase / glutathione hydrolase